MKNWEIKSNDLPIRCEQNFEQEGTSMVTVCILAAGKYSKAEVSSLLIKEQKDIDAVCAMLLKNLVKML